jgi:hypothetical protein
MVMALASIVHSIITSLPEKFRTAIEIAYRSDSSFGKTVCYQCHTIVKTQDYIFTAYPLR